MNIKEELRLMEGVLCSAGLPISGARRSLTYITVFAWVSSAMCSSTRSQDAYWRLSCRVRAGFSGFFGGMTTSLSRGNVSAVSATTLYSLMSKVNSSGKKDAESSGFESDIRNRRAGMTFPALLVF